MTSKEETMSMLNGAYITMVKGTEKRIFFMFEDGSVRNMTHGIGEVIDYYVFIDLYNSLLKAGYIEI